MSAQERSNVITRVEETRLSRAERNCTGRAEQNYTTERRGMSIEVPWYLRT